MLRKARRAATRGRYTSAAAGYDREQLRHAVLLLAWLEQHDLTVEDLTQAHLDEWMAKEPTHRRSADAAFVTWTVVRRLTPELVVARLRDDVPSRFIAAEHHLDLLRRCLTGHDSTPLDARALASPAERPVGVADMGAR